MYNSSKSSITIQALNTLVLLFLRALIMNTPSTTADINTTVKNIFTEYMVRCGLRKTPERYAILEEVYKYNGHFNVDTLYESMMKKKFKVSRATVYNTIEHLLNCQLVTKHQFGQTNFLYEKSFAYRQHDHLICGDCKKVFEFCDPRIGQIQSTIGKLLNFTIAQHSLNLFGKCNKMAETGHCENFKL